MIFNCIQMGINSAQRGAGNTKITMRTNVTSNTINIILTYLLINGHFGFPALGIQGAALATVTATAVGCVMSILSITKQDGFLNLVYLLKNKIKPTLAAFISLVRVGYSVFFEQVVMRIGFMMTAIMAAKQLSLIHISHHIPMLFMLDIINGFKTIFPIPLGQGATFEPELSEKCAAVAAKEAAVSGLHVTFAPMTDLVRDARWGRVMESTGEDPYLNCLFLSLIHI